MTALWRTDGSGARPPSVIDECATACSTSRNRSGARYASPIGPESALERFYPGERSRRARRPALRFLGGRRPRRSPALTAAVTEHTVRLHRETALALLERDVRALQQDLSLKAAPAEVPPALAAERRGGGRGSRAVGASVAFRGEPYRQLTAIMLARLRSARRANRRCAACPPTSRRAGSPTRWGEGPPPAGEPGDDEGAYRGPEELLGSLHALRRGLEAQGAPAWPRARCATSSAGSRSGFHPARASTCASTAARCRARSRSCWRAPASRRTTWRSASRRGRAARALAARRLRLGSRA